MRLSLFLLLLGGLTALTPAAEPKRLVQQRPTEGRFVETDRGFMVPYTQRIPGSNVSIEMIPVPGGEMKLGPLPPLPEDAEFEGQDPSTTKQSTTVLIKPFWMSKYEITMEQFLPYREQYYKFKRAENDARSQKGLTLDSVDAVTGPTDVYEPSYNFEYATKPSSPVPTSSQFSARQYTKWLFLLTGKIYRLPFRSEWQHACRAGSKTAYSFGDSPARIDEFAVLLDETLDVLVVGSKKPNPWDLFDMHGNVAEWVIEDTATEGLIEGHVACGGSWFFGPDEKLCRSDSVIRSGKSWWEDDPEFPRSPWWMTSEDSRGIGFRILSPLQKPTGEEKRTYWEVDTESLKLDVQSRLESGRGSLGRVAPPK